jgi:serine/threonine protein kinase
VTLTPGSRFGTYEIIAPLGAGGMGEVYRARDTRLDRDVALNVLPLAFTRDPDRLARFEREAKVLASLNHPGIATIHGIEEHQGVRALVLELVEGGTLADRMAGRRVLPVEEVLAVAGQIAEALDAAHERGIVHRDLKPSNVGLTPAGVVKVLDFGVAKTTQVAAIGNGPVETETIAATAPGATQADWQSCLRWCHGLRHRRRGPRARAELAGVAARHSFVPETPHRAMSSEGRPTTAARHRRRARLSRAAASADGGSVVRDCPPPCRVPAADR